MVINTAEMDFYESFEKVKNKDLKKIINVNNLAPVLLIKALLPQLQARKEKSAIVNLSFGGCKFPMANYSSYLASRTMINHFTRSLAMEYPNIDILLYTPFDVTDEEDEEEQSTQGQKSIESGSQNKGSES
mmetsp:Transcript_31027/g.28215  ORF Transcript_31027/g.28215 Transcript_31027/m.28215 type:complete len:131 (+) Transcript_31027:456-848(+)|eukprot:CAMPEP_0114583402 /NCGR_PEP_ID=MMETSP0125-20121206/7138_1 /TAXON_ID=485358 ORGANISM="Aristerostoma sp., Strain ATCC 50986" /NCGR_SAMPLE_ID=MMETSP0125 /ASSEMBLY_ACC=CAM_ASM_000245 /LENGTH=130 /DNA_ID=CAMNT_0001776829 /DNA_START=456 /DNA_END=848 /DNA_ORIENTATION=-